MKEDLEESWDLQMAWKKLWNFVKSLLVLEDFSTSLANEQDLFVVFLT